MEESVRVDPKKLASFVVALFDNIAAKEMEKRFIWAATSRVPLTSKNTMKWSAPWPGKERKNDQGI